LNKDKIKKGSIIPFVVMKYIPGANIYRRKDIDLLSQLFSALIVLQKYHIVHNDLNFTNIIYDGERYILIDFDESYVNVINNVDKQQLFENIGDSLFYPEKSSMSMKDEEGKIITKPFLLDNEDIFSKFYNYAIQSDESIDLFWFVTVLSALLGRQVFTLNLEDGIIKQFQYGIQI